MEKFPRGARVAFVGDSITANNTYLSHIASYYRRNFKDLNVKFFNCGVAGGALINAINSYEIDIALYNPTHIVLTIGINDSERTALLNPKSPERYEILHNAYENFQNAVERFYNLTREKGVELIICTPPPYAEYMDGINAVFPGGYALMLGYAEFFRRFAEKYSLPLCDYHSKFSRLLESECLYEADGVHPNNNGHYRMAEIFLENQGLALDTREIDESLDKWRFATEKLRRLHTTRYLALPNEHYRLSGESLIKRMKERLLEIESGKIKSYATPLAIREFWSEIENADDYVKAIISEMEN